MGSRIVVLGAGGQLGQVLLRDLRKGGHEVAALTRAALDVTQRFAVLDRVAKLRPEVIVNATAFGVDASEEDPGKALAVNAFAVRALADVARSCDASLVQFSSDYVFDGAATAPYRETDRPNPVSVYGATKLLGELYAQGAPRWTVLRVESLYGVPGGKGTIDKMIAEARQGRTLTAFYDRKVSPAHVDDVAAATRRIIEKKTPSGVWHCVNSGFASWQEIAVEIVRLAGSPSNVIPASIERSGLRATRPLFSALSNEKLANAGIELPSWQSALARAVASAPAPEKPISGVKPRA
ncbi:MAG TPA: dTDP-4-dehydrorhamnose reductase [Thermoanaerobaculia bacterium]|nr:dTDP-4-dehydrorhamnose reductase [Thermoanaerobaculia bacterium]